MLHFFAQARRLEFLPDKTTTSEVATGDRNPFLSICRKVNYKKFNLRSGVFVVVVFFKQKGKKDRLIAGYKKLFVHFWTFVYFKWKLRRNLLS